MVKPKLDGVIEAVRYKPDGQVDWVRAYLRRGPTFSDRVLLDRQTLIDHLSSGKLYWAGRRIPLMASTFEVSKPLRLTQKSGQNFLVTGELQAQKDCLEGIPFL